jgi:hypothetical protein
MSTKATFDKCTRPAYLGTVLLTQAHVHNAYHVGKESNALHSTPPHIHVCVEEQRLHLGYRPASVQLWATVQGAQRCSSSVNLRTLQIQY